MAVSLLLFLLSLNLINFLLQRFKLIFYISYDGRTDRVSLIVYHIGGRISCNIGNKLFIKIIFWVRRDVLIGHALFLQDFLRCCKLFLALAGIRPNTNQIDILVFEILIHFLQFRHFRNTGAASIVPEVNDG